MDSGRCFLLGKEGSDGDEKDESRALPGKEPSKSVPHQVSKNKDTLTSGKVCTSWGKASFLKSMDFPFYEII